MTIEEVVRKVLLDEHADVVREAVKAVAAELMELEVSELIGAERGERRPQVRILLGPLFTCKSHPFWLRGIRRRRLLTDEIVLSSETSR